MIIDIFAVMDDAPLILRSNVIIFSAESVRVLLYASYNPQASGWPTKSFYPAELIHVHALLIGGRRFPQDPSPGPIPLPETFKFYEEIDSVTGSILAIYITVGITIESLWIYRRIQFIATSQKVISYYGSRPPDGTYNPPMIFSMPLINKTADALRYSVFSFETLQLAFIKDRQSIFLYGGQMFIAMQHRDEYTKKTREFNIGRYILNHISYSMDNAEMTGIDFRYFLNAKYPVDVFTRSEFPFLQEAYIDKIKPAVIGIGNGIPGIPLNGLQIYTTLADLSQRILRYDFQFPPDIKESIK